MFLTGCPPAGGNILTIIGTNFYGPVASTISVSVGCVGALNVSADFTRIFCTLAGGVNGSTSSSVIITTNGGTTAANIGFTIHYGNTSFRSSVALLVHNSVAHLFWMVLFVCWCGIAAPPTLLSLSHAVCSGTGPISACPPAGGDILTLVGTNFYGNGVVVSVGCKLPLTINQQYTRITCVLAAGVAGNISDEVIVTTNGGSTDFNGFTIQYADKPIVSSLSHQFCSGSTALTACRPAGTGTLTITGAHFYGPISTIRVNVGCALPLTIDLSFTQIYCSLAPGTGGTTTAPLVVYTNGGNSTTSSNFTIHYGMYTCRSSVIYLLYTICHPLTVGRLL